MRPVLCRNGMIFVTLSRMKTLTTLNTMATIWPQRLGLGLLIGLLAACAGQQPARISSATTAQTYTPAPAGYYRVQRGDNLYRIGLRFGQSVNTLAAWNNLSNPGQIEVGQLLRVRRQAGDTTSARSSASNANTASGSAQIQPANQMRFQWPVKGPILASYNGTTRKGIDIGGSRGTPIQAAADGTVLYAGNEVRGYGNLVLIRHSSNTLTAYAHNDSLRVRRDQKVKAGEVIATMGDSGADRVKLHFEIRIGSKAVNPIAYLPK